MSLGTALQGVAKTAIKKFGKQCTYRRFTNAAYNTTTGKATPTSADTTITPIVTGYDAKDVRGAVQTGDVRVMVAATDPGITAFTPTLNDMILIDTVPYGVVGVSPVYAQDKIVSYDIQVRR